jgi:hypothetical protein
MSTPKKHHQVPQFLLRGFAFDGGRRLHAFDKKTGARFPVSVGDAAAQNGYYNFEVDGKSVSIETQLSQLEASASAVIAKILQNESLAHVAAAEREWLALFVAVQWSRSPNARLMVHDLVDRVTQLIDESRGDGRGSAAAEDCRDALVLDGIARARRLAPLILGKAWVLQKVSGQAKLYVSDSPLTLHNHRDFGPYGNLGFAVPWIEIHLPISSELNLWMICPRLYSEFERGHDLGRHFRAKGLDAPEARRAIDLVERIRAGVPLVLSDDNVMFLNHLQVAYASRFVYSVDGEFSLVQRMLKDDERFREGRRLQF